VAAKQEHRRVVGQTIRKHRVKAGLSIERLADRADLHYNYVGELERGEKAASLDSLVKIAKGLGVRPWKLLAQL
jgi:transcriptional regulator with XRE-family HTH domain